MSKEAGIPIRFDEDAAKSIVKTRMIEHEVFYVPQKGDQNEVELLEAGLKAGISFRLIGPTGAGKSHLLQYLCWKHRKPYFLVVGDPKTDRDQLVGTPVAEGDGTVFLPGEVTIAAKVEGIIALEEVLEMQPDALTSLHGVGDIRRVLPLPYVNQLLQISPGFMMALSYNEGAAYHRSGRGQLKPSIMQRFPAIYFKHHRGNKGVEILTKNYGIDTDLARSLDQFAVMIDGFTRGDQQVRLDETVGYHALGNAARLIRQGIAPLVAVHCAISCALSSNQQTIDALDAQAKNIFK